MLRPRLRVDPNSTPNVRPSTFFGTAQTPLVAAEPTPSFSNTSRYRSSKIQISIPSESVKIVTYDNGRTACTLPVFSSHDRKIYGEVGLDASCSQGRLSITIEGAFVFTSGKEQERNTKSSARVFFSASQVLLLTPEESSPRSASGFIASIRRRPSVSAPNPDAPKGYPFQFDVPCGRGEELPSTFYSTGQKPRSSVRAETAEVAYVIRAKWEPLEAYQDTSILEAPIIFQTDHGFDSLDGLTQRHDAWLEMPLRSDRALRFNCAVTLPSPGNFPRAGAGVPYFVVFTTTPRCPELAREIAGDASICVSLIRQITICALPSPALPPSPPYTPSTSSTEDSDAPLPAISKITRTRLLKRNAKSTPNLSQRNEEDFVQPQTPQGNPHNTTPFVETTTLSTSMSIGFPKRPRHRIHGSQKHPSLEMHSSLPDGLNKGTVKLEKTMLPSLDWGGVSIKYYLDVSVQFGADDIRARIPLKIY